MMLVSSHLLGKKTTKNMMKRKKCIVEHYKTEAQRPQWLAMPFVFDPVLEFLPMNLEKSKKTLKVAGKLFMKSSRELKKLFTSG